MILGLLIAICYVPGYTGASIPTQWVVLSCLLLPSLWTKDCFLPVHKLGLFFLAYVCASALWAQSIYNSVLGIWYAIVWSLSFWYGATQPNLHSVWKGLAIGLSISSLVAVAQALGYIPVPTNPGNPPGLLFNSTLQATAIALVLLALTTHRLWLYMPIPIIGLILANSRGAYLVLAAVLALRFLRWQVALTIFVVATLTFTTFLIPADSMRLQIWGYALRGLSIFGQGPDAFNNIYFLYNRNLIRAEFVHNDYLQLIYEYGIGALAPFGLLALGLHRRRSPEWPALCGFAIFATFYFPFYAPLTAFIGCACAGHLLRNAGSVRTFSLNRRSPFLSWNALSQSNRSIPWRQTLSVVPRTSHSEA